MPAVVDLVERAQRLLDRRVALLEDGVPHSSEAEVAVLGALLIDSGAWTRVRSIVAEGDFYAEAHRVIFRTLDAMLREDARPDVVLLADSLRGSGELEAAGGLEYVQGLVDATPTAKNAAPYARIVAKLARQRELGARLEMLRARALAKGANVDEIAAEGQAALAGIPSRRQPTPALDLHQLAGQTPPERAWALLYWLAMGHSHLLVGPGGIGKSTLLLQLAASLALGRDFIDHVPRPLRTLVWACEDDADEIWRRLVAVARWLDVPLEALAENLLVVPRHGRENVLFTVEGGRLRFTPVLEELRAQALDSGAGVVMLDNLAHLFGADENRRHDVTTFLNGLAGALPGTAIVLAGHPSRAEGSEFSGSSAWENAVRARIYLGRSLPDQLAGDGDHADESVRYLARRKANYSARDWRRFHYVDGVLVPDDPEPAAGGMVAHLRTERAERVVIEGARRLLEMGLRITDGVTSPQFLPKLLLEYRLGDGCTKGELASAMRAAMLDGRLVRGEVGRYPGNRTAMFGLVVAGA